MLCRFGGRFGLTGCLTASAPTVAEGNSGTATLTYTVTLNKAATEAFDVDYATQTTGTATAGTDFVAASGKLSFAIGETSKTVSVIVNGDTVVEADETVQVLFSGAKLTASVTATGTITNDDVAGSLALTTATTDNIVGTSADETITAINSSLLSEGTLQGTDKIDGGTGADALALSMKQSFAGFTSGSMKAVETVNITSATSAASEFNAAGVTGATKYVIDATTGLVTLKNLDTLAAIEVTGPVGTNTFTAAYAAASTVVTGTQTDIQTLKVTNTGTIDTDATAATNAKFLTVDIDSVETLEVTTAGTSNSLDLSASANVKTIKVSGAGQTEITALDTAVTSFDASGATGVVIVNTSNAATNVLTTVKTGTANDAVVVASDDLTANAVISGSTGDDTLSFTSGGAKILQGTVTGFETVKVGAITGALTFSGTNVADIATITTEGMGAAASFVNMKATAVTVNSVGAEATAADKISVDSAAAITYNLKASTAATTAGTTAEANNGDAEFANATAVTINVGELIDSTGNINTGAATSVTLNVASKVVSSVETTKFNDTLTADKATALTINSQGQLETAAAGAAEATSVIITAGSSATATDTLALTAAKATSVSVTAKQAFDFTGSTLTKAQVVTVDTAKAFTMGGVALADAASVTVGGTASTSAATFAVLGDAAVTHNVDVTATGLKAGLTTGTITSDTGSSTIDIGGVTGNVEIGNVSAKAGITVKASTLGGTLDATSASTYTTTTGNINIDVSSAVGATKFGTLTTNGTTGDVTVTATSALGKVIVGVIKGDEVTVNGQNALNGFEIGDLFTAFTGAAGEIVAGATVGANVDIVAKTAVNYTGTNLTNNGVNIGTDATSTALVATLAGGSKDESISIAGNTKQTSITVSGNLGAGTNALHVLMAGNTASTDTTAAQTVNLSGVSGSSKATTSTSTTLADLDSNITYTGSAVKDTVTLGGDNDKAISITDSVIDTVTGEQDTLVLGASNGQTFGNLSVSGFELLTVATNAVTANAAAFSGDTMTATLTTVLTLTDTTGNDTIDLANFTHAAAADKLIVTATTGNDSIIGATGAGTYAGGDGNDSFNLTKSNAAADIVQFTGTAITSANAATVINNDTVTGFVVGSGSFSDVMKFGSAFLGGNAISDVSVGAASAFASGNDADIYVGSSGSAADEAAVVTLTGAFSAAGSQKAIYIVNDATGNANIWYVNDSLDGAETTVTATDVVLIGTLSATSAAGLLAANFGAAV